MILKHALISTSRRSGSARRNCGKSPAVFGTQSGQRGNCRPTLNASLRNRSKRRHLSRILEVYTFEGQYMASFRSVYCKFSECNVRPANIAELVLALWLVVGPAAWGETWPGRPIRVVGPVTPGTGIALVARGVGARLSERLGVPVVIDNRAGASGNIGSEFVARAAPDGHILIVTAGTFVNNTAVYLKLRYDPIRDFAPIALLATGAQMFIVGPASSATSV